MNSTNFSVALILSMIILGRGSKRIMSMIGEATQALSPLSLPVTEEEMTKFASWRVPVYFHPSLYRVLKLTFPRDIGGGVSLIDTNIGFGSMNQTLDLPLGSVQ